MVELSISKRKELALKLKEEIEKEGFKSKRSGDTRIQVEKLPLPKIVPFDTAELNIRVDENKIFFEIIFYFIKVLEDCVEAEEAEKVYVLNEKWFADLSHYLSSTLPISKLETDVEHDIDIQDSLYGFFNTPEEVITLVRKLRELIESGKGV